MIRKPVGLTAPYRADMREVTFFTDDYGNLWRHVETDTVRFWFEAPNRRIHALLMSWEVYDDWGSLKPNLTVLERGYA